MKGRVLLIDDEVNTLRVFTNTLMREGFDVHSARSGEEALQLLEEGGYDVIVTDIRLPGISGDKLLEKIKVRTPEMPVILITAFGTIENAVSAMQRGAYTYLTKPVDTEVLISVVKEAINLQSEDFYNVVEGQYQFFNIIGRSQRMKEVFSLIQRVAKTDVNVLILGESGTGKELVARAIHYSSLRADGPFVPIDCTTIPSELMESELFGYEKGAFTCAYDKKVGLLEMANKGTVFFDEIGDLDSLLQKKLLRFLQEREFFRLGGRERVKVNVRVIAATNRNLEEAVQKNEFREDLYWRLNVISIHLPPLRERREDIPLLVEHFLRVFSKKNRKDIRGIDREVMDIFMAYEWPGNIRELENVMERAVILCPYDTITVECLPRKMQNCEKEPVDFGGLQLYEIERRVILKALNRTGWNQSRAAEILGISRKQLRTKMKNLGLFENRAKE